MAVSQAYLETVVWCWKDLRRFDQKYEVITHGFEARGDPHLRGRNGK